MDFHIQGTGGVGRNRTGIDGFAGRCMTILPPRQSLEITAPERTHRHSAVREAKKPRAPGLGASCVTGAGNETRTRDPDLGKVVLYQLSYSRIGVWARNCKCDPREVKAKRPDRARKNRLSALT